jgi:glycosyltransferase involved in cell wall biosynthesis
VLLRRVAQLRHVPGADVVFLKGPLFLYGPPVLERIVRLLNPRIVFDMDDALWERPAYVESPFVNLIDYAWPRKMAGLARHAVAGNRVIEAYLRDHGARAVTVIPTCVDPARYTQKTYPARGEGDALVLGWTGIRDNLGYLRILGEVLAELSKEFPLVLLVVSDGELELPGVRVVNRPWTAEGELAALQEPDIGLMPLEDTPRARGKCAFKALQYMGVGTPVILSPVGMNTEVVEDGVSGFLADTPEQWKDRIRALAADPALRERMGRAGRARVREAYSFDTHYPRFLEVLRSVAEDTGR